jgi:tetratricopeptide (TPR) repeat protein
VRSHAYSAWQLVRRWARRHAAILAVSGACLALLAAGAVVSVRRIVAEKERANREAATARSVSDFMSDMFKVSNPGQGRGETVTAREILDQAAQRIESGLARDPQVQGRLMLEIGTVYSNLGLYPEAERLLEKAAHTLAQQLGADSRPAVEALVVWAAELQRASKLADAEKLALDARERAVRVFGPRDPVALSAANELALVYFRERRLEESERIGRAALADARATLGADDPLSVKLLSNLGNTCKLLGRPDTEALFEEAVAVSSRVNGPDSLPALMALNNLAGYHRDNGKPEKALELQRQVLEGMRRTLGPDHPTTLIVARNVAAALESLGRYAEMEPYVREALRGREARLGPDNLHTLESVADLGVLLVRLRRFDEAAPLLERALAGYRRVQAATPGPVAQRNVALALCNLADLAAQRGDTERALAQLREALGAGLSPAERRSALEEDELLAPLRSDARFQALVAEAKAGAPAK